jgi:hypothetical protein
MPRGRLNPNNVISPFQRFFFRLPIFYLTFPHFPTRTFGGGEPFGAVFAKKSKKHPPNAFGEHFGK